MLIRAISLKSLNKMLSIPPSTSSINSLNRTTKSILRWAGLIPIRDSQITLKKIFMIKTNQKMIHRAKYKSISKVMKNKANHMTLFNIKLLRMFLAFAAISFQSSKSGRESRTDKKGELLCLWGDNIQQKLLGLI